MADHDNEIPKIILRERALSWGGEQLSEYEPTKEEVASISQQYPYDDDDESLVSLPAELHPPPDGGWGWVVVAASFLCNTIVDGIVYSFSPFLETFSGYFGESTGKIAWIPSLLAGVYLSVGPVVSALSNKFGCRNVCIAGGIVAALAFISTIFATSLEYLMITQGIIGGFGFGLIYLPAVVCVGYYFESKRALATGIAVCGSGAGTFVFPPVVTFLIAHFGWKGTNLLLGGIILNCCWLGALMRPLEVPRMKRKDLLYRLAEEKKAAMETASLYGSNYLTITQPDGTVIRQPRKSLNPDPGVHSHLNLTGYFTSVATNATLPTIQESQGGAEQESPTATVATLAETSPTEANVPALHDEHQTLVEKSPRTSTTSQGKPTSSKMPRNCSTPLMAYNGTRVIPKNGSVPNFERRLSKADVVSLIKVVPATDSSTANLRTLGSQDFRKSSSGYGRVSSSGSFAESELGVLHHRRPSKEKQMKLPPMSRQDIFYSGSIANLQEFKSQPSMLSYRESTLNLQGTGASSVVMDALDGICDEEEEKKRIKCCPESIRGPLSQMLDFSLLKNPAFLLVGVANMFGMLGFYTPFVYLPSAAIEKGIEKEYATFLVSIIGITNTVGRVLSGLLADLPRIDALWLNNICLVLSATCVFFTPFAHTYSSFAVISVFFGFFVSGYVSLSSIILVEMLGLANLTNAFGLLILFRGSSSIVGAPISGSIYDATKSYDVSFYVAGGLLYTAALLHSLVPCVKKCYPGKDTPVKYVTNTELLPPVPEETESLGNLSPDTAEGAGIVFDISKPKAAGEVAEEADAGDAKADDPTAVKESSSASAAV